MAEKKETAKKQAVKVVLKSAPCNNLDCKFFGDCDYRSDGTYTIPEACMVCVFYMGVRFNTLA